jgi:hypothetical protein
MLSGNDTKGMYWNYKCGTKDVQEYAATATDPGAWMSAATASPTSGASGAKESGSPVQTKAQDRVTPLFIAAIVVGSVVLVVVLAVGLAVWQCRRRRRRDGSEGEQPKLHTEEELAKMAGLRAFEKYGSKIFEKDGLNFFEKDDGMRRSFDPQELPISRALSVRAPVELAAHRLSSKI